MLTNRVRPVLIVSAILALTPFLTPLRAQFVQMAPAKETSGEPRRDWTDDVPAHLAFVDGQVTLERDGKLEPAVANMALLAGDRLRTLGGRVEILYSDGSTLAVDEETEIDLLDDSLVRLVDGRLRMTIPRSTEDLDYRIDAPAAFVEIRSAGEYRIDTGVDQHGEADVDLVVFRGQAELVNDLGRTLVRAGKHAVASATEEPSLAVAVNSAAWDEFDRWADDRRTARVGSASAAYLPEEERYYSSALDYNGTWENEADYGPVWYPRVAADWRPYSQGSWSYTSHYGWLWVGIDNWSWPTHHYGRWGISSNRWFWIPGRQWGPAWVAWGSAPGFVSWCPLGLDGHATVGFRPIDVPYIGVPSVDPFTAWTIVPASGFAHNVWVTEHAVARNGIPPQVRGEFRERPLAPIPAGNAVSKREIPPIHAPTAPRNVATPRGRPTSGPFDAARTSGRTGGGATTRAPISSTIIGPPVPTGGAGDAARALPSSRSVAPDRPATTPSRVPRPASNSIDVPRVQAPPDAPSRSVAPPQTEPNRTTPARAIPRPTERTVAPPSAGVETGRAVQRAPEPDRAAPAAPAQPPPPDSSRDRGRAVDRTTPAQPAAPPSSAVPAPSRGGRSSEPPAAAPPPAAQPPATTPPATPPGGRGRGGGGSSSTATGATTTSQGKVVTGTGRGGGGGGE